MSENSNSNGGESENNNVVEIAGDGMELNGEAKIHGTAHIFVDGEPLCGNPHVARNYESGRYFARGEEFPLGTHGLCEHCGRSFANDFGSNDEQFATAGELREGDYVALETESGEELVGRVRHDDPDGFPRRFLTLVLSDEPRERWAYGVEKSVKVKVRAGDGIVTENGMMTEEKVDFEVASFEPTGPENDIDARTEEVVDELSELVSEMELGEYGGAKTAGKEVEKFAVGIKGEERLNDLKNLLNDARRFEVVDVTPASEREHSSYSTVVVETRRFDEFEVARTDNNEPLSAGDEITVSGGSFDGSMTYRVAEINGSRVTLDDGRSMPGTHTELVSEPDAETDGGEPEVMTDGGSQLDEYDWSDIEIPEEGQVAEVTYLSDRSGNEKTVSGPIERVSRMASRVGGEMKPGISLRVRDGERDIKVNTPRGTVSSIKSQYTRLGDLVDIEYREPVTDGGSRVHPDDEGVEILDSENDDDSDIIDAGDDGIIMTDGGVKNRYLMVSVLDDPAALYILSDVEDGNVPMAKVGGKYSRGHSTAYSEHPYPRFEMYSRIGYYLVIGMDVTASEFSDIVARCMELNEDELVAFGKDMALKPPNSDSGNEPEVMTDGGRPQPSRREPYTVECKEEDCSFTAGPLPFGRVNRNEAEHYIDTADADGSNGHRLRVRQHMPDSARDSGQYEPAGYEHRVVVCIDCGRCIQHMHKEPDSEYSLDDRAERYREQHLDHHRNPPEGGNGEPVREPSEHTVIILDASNDRPTIDCR